MSENSETIRVLRTYLAGDFSARSEDDDELSLLINEFGNHMEEQALTTAVATEGVSATTQQIAESSDQASSSSQRAIDAVQQGSDSVDSAVELMREMSSSARKAMTEVEQLEHFSHEIGAIVEAIQRIAGQTNMLALNATIEAARAGEAGKGFAVVAGEVKALSQQTAGAAIEIRDKIGHLQGEINDVVAVISENVEKAEQGSKIAENTSSSMNHITDAFHSVMEMIEHIRQLSHSQGHA